MSYQSDIHVGRTVNGSGATTSVNIQAYDNAAVPAAVAATLNGNQISSTGGLLSPSTAQGIGYTTGAGGAVTQATNRTTGVTLDALCGAITTNTASLAAESSANFTLTNSKIAANDVVVVSIKSGTDGGNTAVSVVTTAAGSCVIKVANHNAAAGTAETGAIIILFAVIKAVAA